MYANYQYSLTSEQQSAIQIWLRLLPKSFQDTYGWRLLHELTYTEDWTPDDPKYTVGVPELDAVAAKYDELGKYIVLNSKPN